MLAIDWIATLKEQGDFAAQMSRDVKTALSHSDLTVDQASRLYRTVEKGAQDFDRIVEDMQEYDLDDSLFEVAEALEDFWSEISVATANRVRTMQGLAPIEMPPDDDDD
jgi:hypothetical protein